MRCCCGKEDIDTEDGVTLFEKNGFVHQALGEEGAFCGSKSSHEISGLIKENGHLADTLENLMGHIDTPISRRKLGDMGEDFDTILKEARKEIEDMKERRKWR